MRHLIARRKLNRTKEHRLALRRNMAQSLFEHGQIRTTLPKAKDLRPFVERLITLARKAREGSLAARQRLIAIMGDRAMIPKESQDEYEMMSDAARRRVLRSRSGRRHRLGQARGGQKFTAISIVNHLINNVAGEFEDRPGGYTRVIHLGTTGRVDNAEMAILQLVGQEESPGTVTRPEKTARQRRTERRYAAAAKAIKKVGRGPAAASAPEEPAAPSDSDQPAEPSGGGEANAE
ncbi:MAG: 50S ribosomal protein L17 [Planctomycetes bacterium]|nr:50S ribosomal protein L17 [Planctomycetota bacterium]